MIVRYFLTESGICIYLNLKTQNITSQGRAPTSMPTSNSYRYRYRWGLIRRELNRNEENRKPKTENRQPSRTANYLIHYLYKSHTQLKLSLFVDFCSAVLLKSGAGGSVFFVVNVLLLRWGLDYPASG